MTQCFLLLTLQGPHRIPPMDTKALGIFATITIATATPRRYITCHIRSRPAATTRITPTITTTILSTCTLKRIIINHRRLPSHTTAGTTQVLDLLSVLILRQPCTR